MAASIRLYTAGTATELAAAVRAGDVSAVALAEAALERVATDGARLNAVRLATERIALRDAAAVDAAVARGEDPGPLAGVPVGVKDNLDLAGTATRAASPLTEDVVADEDAFVVARLRAAGAVVVARLHMSEWAIGGTTQNAWHGPALNAWDPARTTGGSSGGSGTAVAAGVVPLALGTDTGGSVRLPSALNGVAGLRPTHGRVSNDGCVPVAPSFDTIGPMATTVADLALAIDVLAGHDPRDPTSADVPHASCVEVLAKAPGSMRAGFLADWTRAAADPAVAAAVQAAAQVLARAGVGVVEVALPGAHDVADLFADLAMDEAAAFHAERLATTPDGFAPDVRARLERGARVTDPRRAEAWAMVAALRAEVDAALDGVDVLLSPTTPVVAPRLDVLDPLAGTGLLNPFAGPFALTGHPAATVPCGFADGMPIGLQLVGRRFDEATVLRAAARYEGATEWHCKRPPGGDR